ncbi:MAG: tRNA (guanosine(46)-N7)-methyltransferase TrmB [Sedimentisphaerales bacterium]|nr:tRNA (guanosine(46)-N7)-methyltransferase TrmB [Sedimentisphaerales bacterium]
MPLTNEDIAVNLDNLPENNNLESLFQRPAPLHLEVGSGKGTFLLNQAKAHPEFNYLGIEWANKFYLYSVDRMRRWQIDNVRVLRTDARDFINRYIADACIDTFHVYFPDPWPKKRHHKRRFFTPANILQVHRCLRPGGFLRAATDHADYFQAISELMLQDPKIAPLFEPIDFHPTASADPGEWVGSNFERKYIKEGRQFYTIALAKR